MYIWTVSSYLAIREKVIQTFYPKHVHFSFHNGILLQIWKPILSRIFSQHVCCLHYGDWMICITSTGQTLSKTPEHSDLQSWIRVSSYLPKLFPSFFILSSSFSSEKIGIIYCCHCRAHCPPLSQGQSCRDIELIRACFNFAFRGRKQIKSSGKWWQGGAIPQAK